MSYSANFNENDTAILPDEYAKLHQYRNRVLEISQDILTLYIDTCDNGLLIPEEKIPFDNVARTPGI